MTGEEEIEILQGAIKKPNTKDGYLGQALDMAIQALEQEPYEDAVSRQAVLDELGTCFDTHSIYDENNGENYIIYEDAVDMMEKLPSVTPTRKWIPCSERLPEENGGYLVTVRGYVTTALWVGEAKNWDEVTAWMPLPEPYKEGV